MRPAQLETFAGAHVHCAAELVRGQARLWHSIRWRGKLYSVHSIYICIVYHTIQIRPCGNQKTLSTLQAFRTSLTF